MELKPDIRISDFQSAKSLNRTFYGIETCDGVLVVVLVGVLIVPFMELKQYTLMPAYIKADKVLIVPFMELKPAQIIVI